MILRFLFDLINLNENIIIHYDFFKSDISYMVKLSSKHESQLNIIDFPSTLNPSGSFSELVVGIGLSKRLEEKVLYANSLLECHNCHEDTQNLSLEDEQELGIEVLLCRHRFTELLTTKRSFKQAAISIIQNIYTTKERKIFFDNQGMTTEQERQQALLLFSQKSNNSSVPLSKTLQHHIIARVWYRILYKVDPVDIEHGPAFVELNKTVERLNTLRNIYMLLSSAIVKSMSRSLCKTYKQSITYEDAHQIGMFGIARAAYRYHPTSRARFSTYASYWVKREVQLQALKGRLIRISPNLLEKISLFSRTNDESMEQSAVNSLLNTTVTLDSQVIEQKKSEYSDMVDPADLLENKELSDILLTSINSVLSAKSSDILKRKYGLDQYEGRAQRVVEISEFYGVTRGSVYQLEKVALNKLQKHLLANYAYS